MSISFHRNVLTGTCWAVFLLEPRLGAGLGGGGGKTNKGVKLSEY